MDNYVFSVTYKKFYCNIKANFLITLIKQKIFFISFNNYKSKKQIIFNVIFIRFLYLNLFLIPRVYYLAYLYAKKINHIKTLPACSVTFTLFQAHTTLIINQLKSRTFYFSRGSSINFTRTVVLRKKRITILSFKLIHYPKRVQYRQ